MKKMWLFLCVILMLLCMFSQTAYAAESSTFDQDLANYLAEVSAIRGFDVSTEDIDESLAAYGLTTADFSTVDNMKTFLGDAIQSDLSNLSSVYEEYGLDQTTLTQKLNEYGEELNDYVYVYDLDTALSVYASKESSSSDLNQAMVIEILKQFDISDSEIQNLKDYYLSMQDYVNSDEVAQQLQDIRTRMTALGETLIAKETADAKYKPTDAEISQISSMYDELFSVLKLKAEFYLTKDGADTPITLIELLKLDDVGSADVKAKLYTSDSVLLADMVVPNEMFSSKLEEAVKDVSKSDDNTTEKGGKLPKTASDYLENALLGLFIAAAGIFTYRKVRIGNFETYKKQA